MVPGPVALPTDAEIMEWLGTAGAQNLLGGTTINNNHFDITGVTGQEVVDALGGHVDLNGPLPPHWQQAAT